MPESWSRRGFLKLATSSTIAAGLPTVGRAKDGKIRMGFIGVGSRGTGLLRLVVAQPEVEIPAVCDIDEKHLNRALDLVQKAKGRRPTDYSRGPYDYRRMLEREDLDAVLIATPQEWHAVMSVDAMRAGKFVGSEVPACTTLQECWDLVRTHEETGTGYMFLENYCYSRHAMQILHMVQKGVFGELTYAECAYIHELRGMRFNPDGSLTWRGVNVAENIGNLYPTHAIGPVSQWMGINRTDRLTSMVAMASKSAALEAYALEKFGPDHPAAKIRFKNGDTNNALIQTQQGRMIEIRYDVASPRPSGMGQYALQGIKASYESAFGQHKIYIEGRSRQHQWEPLDAYAGEFLHPYWVERGEHAKNSGHGGGDYFVIADFLQAIRTAKSPIDIYDAVTWSSLRPLSAQSIQRGSQPVDIPDFTARRQRLA